MARQQGDMRLVKGKIPAGAQKLNHLILARGKATGHCHQVLEGAGKAELYEKNGILYLRVLDDEVKIVHEEHKPLTVPQGDFVVKRVREYDHFLEESRNVKD